MALHSHPVAAEHHPSFLRQSQLGYIREAGKALDGWGVKIKVGYICNLKTVGGIEFQGLKLYRYETDFYAFLFSLGFHYGLFELKMLYLHRIYKPYSYFKKHIIA